MMVKGEAIDRIQSLLRAQRDPKQPLGERLKLPGQYVLRVDREREAKRLGLAGHELARALAGEAKRHLGPIPATTPPRRRMRFPPGWFAPAPPPDTAGYYEVPAWDRVQSGNNCAYDGSSWVVGTAGSWDTESSGFASAQPPGADDVAMWFSWLPPEGGNAWISTDVTVWGTASVGADASPVSFGLRLSCRAYQTDPDTGDFESGASSASPVDFTTQDQIDLVIFNGQSYPIPQFVIGVEPTAPLIISVAATLTFGGNDGAIEYDFCPGFLFDPISINFIPWRDDPPVG